MKYLPRALSRVRTSPASWRDTRLLPTQRYGSLCKVSAIYPSKIAEHPSSINSAGEPTGDLVPVEPPVLPVEIPLGTIRSETVAPLPELCNS
jgi:hypothetical protein